MILVFLPLLLRFHSGASMKLGGRDANLQLAAAGDYLVRVEQIGLHVASSKGGAQFYIACGQIEVTGSGSGSFSPTVKFP
jgi:hypothetical protein